MLVSIRTTHNRPFRAGSMRFEPTERVYSIGRPSEDAVEMSEDDWRAVQDMRSKHAPLAVVEIGEARDVKRLQADCKRLQADLDEARKRIAELEAAASKRKRRGS